MNNVNLPVCLPFGSYNRLISVGREAQRLLSSCLNALSVFANICSQHRDQPLFYNISTSTSTNADVCFTPCDTS